MPDDLHGSEDRLVDHSSRASQERLAHRVPLSPAAVRILN
jgi:hypothetical protein